MFLNIILFKIALPYLYVSIRQGWLVSGTYVLGGGCSYSVIFDQQMAGVASPFNLVKAFALISLKGITHGKPTNRSMK